MIKLAVFDMAGTTVDDSDNAVATCVCDALRAVGADHPLEAVNEVMGMPKPLAVAHLLAAAGLGDDAELAARTHADFQRRMIEHYRTSPTLKPCDGAEEAFVALRGLGVRVALDTGFDRSITDAILERLGWAVGAQIDDSITSDEVDNGRPHPDMIDRLAERAGITSNAQVAKIGDSVSDIEQGLNARCGLVAAIVGERTQDVLPEHPSVIPVTHLREFVAAIESRVGQTEAAAS